MEFNDADRVRRPPGAPGAWCLQPLTQIRRDEMGDIAIRLEVSGRGEVVGNLERVSTVLGTRGTIFLSQGERISCDDIEAYTVIVEEPYEKGSFQPQNWEPE